MTEATVPLRAAVNKKLARLSVKLYGFVFTYPGHAIKEA